MTGVSKLAKQRYTDTVMTDALLSDQTAIADDEGENMDLLRHIQVTVNISQQQLMEFDSRNDLAEVLLPNVLQKIQEIAACTTSSGFPRSSSKSARFDEVYQLELKPDMSLRVARPSSVVPTKQQDFSKALSPEKTGSSYAQLKRLQPSPVRKLVLGSTAESEEDEEEEEILDNKSANWKIVSIKKLSEFNVVCMVEVSKNKILLNVVFNVLERVHPASPTTGLRMPPTSALIAQMGVAKSGFALVPLGEEGILSVGGYTRDGVLLLTEFYDSHFNCWDQREELNTKRARFAAVQCDGVPYIIGGSDGKNELGSIEIYRSKSCTWEKNSSRMVTPRSCFDAATIDGRIYAVGGMYYSTPLKSAEVFDPCLQKWRLIPGMHTSRYGLSVAACCGKLYAIGGQTLGWNTLAMVECYDPKTNAWSKVASMKTPRRNTASVSINGKIYVFGGYNGSAAVNLVEIYDPRENIWRCLPPMCTKRSSASAVHINGYIFVAGGYSGTSFLNSVERYNIKTNQWSSHT